MRKNLQRVLIEKLDEKALGKGHIDLHGQEREVSVPYTLPGEEVQIAYHPKKSELIKLLMPSPDRQKAACKHFTSCGGCSLQHLSYSKQLAFKENYVRSLFGTCLPILASESPWQYRNKMEFSFSQTAKEKFLGLKGARGKVIDLEECHLVDPSFMCVLRLVRQWWDQSGLEAYHYRKDTGALRAFVVRKSIRHDTYLMVLLVSGNPNYALTKKQIRSLEEILTYQFKKPFSLFLRIQQIKKGQPTQFFESKICGDDFLSESLQIDKQETRFSISPQAFFQPNTLQAERFYQKALDLAQISSEDLVYDLYCGTGTIGILAASRARQVIGMELCPDACVDARQNISDLGIKNMKIIEGDVGVLLEQTIFEAPDVLILDPPRAGLGEKAIAHIKAFQSKKIIYISCNPKTQAEDIAHFSDYHIEAIQPIDAFPQTAHIENIILLRRA